MGNFKTNALKFFTNTRKTLVKHSPEILTGLGIAGMLTTTVLAVKATPKAVRLIEEKKKEERVEKLKPVEVIKATWKCYIPATVTGVTSIACLIGANSVQTRRNAALAAAYTLSEKAFAEYKEKVIETIGEKKEEHIREEVVKERTKDRVINDNEIFITDRGETLFLDTITDRVFKSDIEFVKKAVNKVNYELTHDISGFVSLNDFYDELGLGHSAIGDSIGWRLDNGAGLLEMGFYPEMKDGKPVLALDYRVAPEYDPRAYY
jgi:hypothetical protein